MERAPELHHLSRRPVQSAGDRICPPEDHCNTGRRPHVEPFASLSLSLSWRWFHENRTLRGTPFQALRHVRRRERCTVTARPPSRASVRRICGLPSATCPGLVVLTGWPRRCPRSMVTSPPAKCP